MLTGIGIIIIIKQIPYFFGYDKVLAANASFTEMSNFISPGATLIAFIGLGILILWNTWLSNAHKFFQIIQGPVVAVGALLVGFHSGKK